MVIVLFYCCLMLPWRCEVRVGLDWLIVLQLVILLIFWYWLFGYCCLGAGMACLVFGLLFAWLFCMLVLCLVWVCLLVPTAVGFGFVVV